MDSVRPGLQLSSFFFFWFHPFSKNLVPDVPVKTIFYKSLDLPASSGFKKIQQGFKSITGNELFESGG